jgi:hypothetical protein
MKSFALERLDSEIFEEKSKHTKFGKTEYLEYNNILLDNFRFAFGVSHIGKEINGKPKIDTLHLISEMARSFDEAFIKKIDLFEDKKFYQVNYRNSKLTQIAKIIAIDNDICFKIRNKKFNLNRTMIREMKNESKQNTNI